MELVTEQNGLIFFKWFAINSQWNTQKVFRTYGRFSIVWYVLGGSALKGFKKNHVYVFSVF